MMQVLTGHGCCSEYLCHIMREPTAQCHHCGQDQDSAQHTPDSCPAWADERRVLDDKVGPELSLPSIVSKMLGSDKVRTAVDPFCEVVMTQKETVERVRRVYPVFGETPKKRRTTGRRPTCSGRRPSKKKGPAAKSATGPQQGTAGPSGMQKEPTSPSWRNRLRPSRARMKEGPGTTAPTE